MNPQITAILIGVKDLNRAKSFYGEGLGCPIDKDYPQFVSFKLGDGSSEFGLYPREALAADAGVDPKGSGFTGVTFHYIVSSTAEVDELIGQAERLEAPPQGLQHLIAASMWNLAGCLSESGDHARAISSSQLFELR